MGGYGLLAYGLAGGFEGLGEGAKEVGKKRLEQEGLMAREKYRAEMDQANTRLKGTIDAENKAKEQRQYFEGMG
ncbi:MAG: hypothetical protein HQL56_06935, partial [Magnetococcales bacterium]|nr:hypothetical protein [Magnetococcales bacterium]